jgi:16S rRNA processing protein RimM
MLTPLHPGFSEATPPSQPMIVGKVLTTHGVRGQIKVHSFMQNPWDLGNTSPFWINNQHFTQWSHFKPIGKPGVFLASLANIISLNQAETFRHAHIIIDRSQLPDVEGEIYYKDLEGKAVVDCHGTPMGQVVHVHDFGAGPILELSETGLMISFYAIVDAGSDVLHLKSTLETFL